MTETVHNVEHIKTMMANFSMAEYREILDWVADRAFDPNQTGGDTEKMKWIAQHGNPIEQVSGQAVPQPESNEGKDLQNEVALQEHQAQAERQIADEAAQKQRDKLVH